MPAKTSEKPTETTTTEIIEPETVDEGGTISLMMGKRYKGEPIVSDMDILSEETKIQLYNAGSAPSGKISDLVGTKFVVSHWMAERVRLKFGDQPEYMGCRLTIWLKDGSMFHSSSESIVSGFDRLVVFFGKDLSQLPKQISITNSKTQAGNQWYNVSLT